MDRLPYTPPPRSSPFARPLTQLQRAGHIQYWHQVQERARKRFRALELWHAEIDRGVRSVNTVDALAEAARLEIMIRGLERRAYEQADAAWAAEDPWDRYEHRVTSAAAMRAANVLRECAHEVIIAAERFDLDTAARRRAS